MAVSSIWLLKTRLPNINRAATQSTQKCKNHDWRGDVSPGPFCGCLVAASHCLVMFLNSSVLPNTSEMYFKTDSIGVTYRWDGCVGPHLLLALKLALCKLRYNEWKLSHIHFSSSSTYNLVFFCLSTTLIRSLPQHCFWVIQYNSPLQLQISTFVQERQERASSSAALV